MNTSTTLVCPYCDKELKLILKNLNSALFGCNCSVYPELWGIIYLYENEVAKSAVSYIKNGKEINALKIVLNLRRSQFYLLYFLYISKNFFNINLIKFIKIYNIILRSSSWKKYLINRENIDYFAISPASLDFAENRDGLFLDLGCGTGNIFPAIYGKFKPKNVIGLDSSFFSLFLARMFYADKKTILVCFDAEKKLPFKKNSFVFIHSADTFQLIKHKVFLIMDMGRVISKKGMLAIIHTHSRRFKNILGVRANMVRKVLAENGFKDIRVYNDNEIILGLNIAKLSNIFKTDAYNIFASKSRFRKAGWEDIPHKFVFVSPHMDDAVLSAGNLMIKLINLGYKVEVVTVFTNGGKKPLSPQAKSFIEKCGFDDPVKLYKTLALEDQKAMRRLGVEYKHLGFSDAAFRKTADRKFVYKSAEKQFSGKIAVADRNLVKEVAKKLRKQLTNTEKTKIFAPLGIGGHVDHMIVRQAVNFLDENIVFWEDFPYNLNKNQYNKFFSNKEKYYKKYFEINEKSVEKKKIIKMYKSQFKMLFPNGEIPQIPEKFYVT